MRIIVTGGNSGIGKGIAAELAAAGHEVVIACRTIDKGERAAAEMNGDVRVAYLDLADLTSVRAFADTIDSVDVLINNAAVFGIPLTRTVDGFEAHMGTNHLGHFALTCLLGDRVTDRVVSVVSSNYAFGTLHLEDVNWHARRYSAMAAYAQSKLAIMLFVDELARRGIRAYAANPGQSATDITRYSTGLVKKLVDRQPAALTWTSQSLEQAARSTIRAVHTDLPSGTYFAPRFKQWGPPRVTRPLTKARSSDEADRLWTLSAELTHCDWHTER